MSTFIVSYQNELVNSCYYTDGSTDTLIESSGIKKTAPQVNAPKNVKKSFANNMMTLTWDAPDAQSDQAVRQYVIYDENNAYPTRDKTWFINATASKTITLAMNQATYDKTNFVVKAIGGHTISEIGTEAQTGSAVSGTVGPLVNLYLNNPTSDSALTLFHSKFGKAEIKLYDENMTSVVKSGFAEVAAAGNSAAFSLSGVPNGKYIADISRAGMCSQLVPVTVSNGNVDLGQITLKPTDADGKYDVAVSDVTALINIYRKGNAAYPGSSYQFWADANGDGVIDLEDALNVIKAYKAK